MDILHESTQQQQQENPPPTPHNSVISDKLVFARPVGIFCDWPLAVSLFVVSHRWYGTESGMGTWGAFSFNQNISVAVVLGGVGERV